MGEDKQRKVRAYGSGLEKTRDQREVFWFVLREVIVGCGKDDVVCQMVDLHAQVGDVKIIEVIGEFGVDEVNENGELILETCVQHKVWECSSYF